MSAQTANPTTLITSYLLLAVWAILSAILLSAVVVDETGIMTNSGAPHLNQVIEHSPITQTPSNIS